MSLELLENSKVRQIIDGIETRSATFSRRGVPPVVPTLRLGSTESHPSGLPRLPAAPSDPSSSTNFLEPFPLTSRQADTAGACLTARVARLLNSNSKNEVQICVAAPPTRHDFVAYARSHGLEDSVAKQDTAIPTLVDYKGSSRCADLWIQVETGHVVFAFGKKTLGCVHISDLESMKADPDSVDESDHPPCRQTSGMSLMSLGSEKKLSLRLRSESRRRNREQATRKTASAVRHPVSSLADLYSQKVEFRIAGRPLPLFVSFQTAETRRNALHKLALLRLFFRETAAEALRG